MLGTLPALGLVYLMGFASIAGFCAYHWLMRETSLVRLSTCAHVNPVIAPVLWRRAPSGAGIGCIMNRTLLVILLLAAAAGAAGCDSPTAPDDQAIVTFRVVDETFRVLLETPGQVRAAEAARAGTGPAIPSGRIVAGTQVNTGWSWHLEDVEFADATIELCDGRPSDVERDGAGFGGGRFCPWSAQVVDIAR